MPGQSPLDGSAAEQGEAPARDTSPGSPNPYGPLRSHRAPLRTPGGSGPSGLYSGGGQSSGLQVTIGGPPGHTSTRAPKQLRLQRHVGLPELLMLNSTKKEKADSRPLATGHWSWAIELTPPGGWGSRGPPAASPKVARLDAALQRQQSPGELGGEGLGEEGVLHQRGAIKARSLLRWEGR